uniref:Ribosomal protein S2 n=1 Tax=Nitzschia alba TaxID=2858 RepID=A0A2R4A3F8_NITAL|nr:ribosomal protein S2 [Nitzschia alba]AVR57584.1 ribosomal protein S2 [Nitzschia alba]
MKIKKFKFKQILELHLLSSRTYEYAAKKSSSNALIDFNLTQVISGFKKSLHVVFEYHQAEKTILFIGVPSKLEQKINKLTNHVAVPHNFDLQGVISNNLKPLKFSKTDKQSASKLYLKSLMPKLKKKPDLVVLFSHEKKQNIVTESYVAKVPLILFDSKGDSKDPWTNNSYNLQGFGSSSTGTFNNNLFFLGLNFLFKTSKKKVREQNVGFNFQSTKKRFK